MPRNRVEDLRNHLFEMLERLKDDKITGDKLDEEIKKARAMNMVAKTIVDSAKAEVDFLKHVGGESSGFYDQKKLI